MTARIDASAVIARPAEEVFSFVLDFEHSAPEMEPDIEAAQKIAEASPGEGPTFRARGRDVFRRRRDFTMQFTRVEPNRRIDFQTRVGPLAPQGTWTFDEVEGGTRAAIRGDANPRGPAKILSPLIRRIGQRLWDRRLARMKAALEA